MTQAVINREHRNTQSGFALLQLMIAIAILASMCVIAWGAVQQISRTKSRSETRVEQYQAGRNAVSRMVQDISMAFLSTNQLPGKEATPRTFFEGIHRGQGDELSFTYFGHFSTDEDAEESDTAVISYRIKPSPENSQKLSLYRKKIKRLQYLDVSSIDRIPGEDEVLCENVTKLELWYYDPVRKTWVDTWRTTQLDGFPNRLPSRVLIKLTVSEDEGKEVPFPSEARLFMFQSVDNSPK